MLPSHIDPRPRVTGSRSRPAFAAVLSLLLSLSLSLLFSLASPALAGEPATVTVRAVGANNQTLVPLTQVTTTTAPVVRDGNTAHSCPGTNALGALQLAVNGNWEGPWNSKFGQYEIWSIAGESHPFETLAPGKPNHFWSFWLDNREAGSGACEAELHTGDSILFFVGCFGLEAKECPTPPNASNVLGIEAPATVEANRAVTVTVLSYPAAGGPPSPAIGATVVGGGDANAIPTDEHGQTTMIFSGDGRYVLHASGAGEGPTSIPGEAFICVHEGNDGTCGTTLPGNSPLTQTPLSSGSSSKTTPYTGPFALVAKATGVSEGHLFPHGRGPRLLTGDVIAHSPVTSTSIELRRSYRGRCYAYNGTRARFIEARCGRGSFFKVAGGGTSFSYLLPAKLPPGRYVLDLRSTDAAGNHTVLARGSTRTVFYVG
jgi:hypothetical protein